MVEKIKFQDNEPYSFVFMDRDQELIRLTSGKFFWKGEEVTDTEKVYERFCEFMNIVEKKP